MVMSENGFGDQKKNVYKKCIQVRLAIIEMANEEKIITIEEICKRTKISKRAVYNYVQYLEKKGELVTTRQGEGKKGEILDMRLVGEAINTTYDQIIASTPENDRKRFLSILEKKINHKA